MLAILILNEIEEMIHHALISDYGRAPVAVASQSIRSGPHFCNFLTVAEHVIDQSMTRFPMEPRFLVP